MVKFRVKPTQKENWRYIAFRILSKKAVKESEVVKALVNSITHFLGELGASDANSWLIDYDEKKGQGIFRCSRDAVKQVVASITLVSKIGMQDAAFLVLGVSGTIKALRKKYFPRNS